MHQATRIPGLVAALGALALLAPGCGDDDGPADAEQDDGAVPDDGDVPEDATSDEGDATPEDTASDEGGPLPEFPIRTPASHEIECVGTGNVTFWDTDYVCRVPLNTTSLELYVQATPTDCQAVFDSGYPIFDDVNVWYKVDGTGDAWPTPGAYDWGGNHHNDQIKFAYDGTRYVLWHSSLGFGWHACAPPDCLLTCEPTATFETCDYLGGFSVDGCDREPGGPPPPAPVICVAVNADGSVPPLDDPWAGADPLLPCAGDM